MDSAAGLCSAFNFFRGKLVFNLGSKMISSRTQLLGKLQGLRISDFPFLSSVQLIKSSDGGCVFI